MLHVGGFHVEPVTTSMPTTAVVAVVEHENQLTEVHVDHGAPQDLGQCSRRSPRRRLQSEIAVVNSLPMTEACGASVGMRNLVQTTVLSSTVVMLPMESPHRNVGQAEITALAVRKSVLSFGLLSFLRPDLVNRRTPLLPLTRAYISLLPTQMP